MSTFKVSLEQIATAERHPDADKLDLCTLEGMSFQFVTGRGQVKPGDWVIYYPLDAILPDIIINRLGLTGKLAGKDKNRVKTARLRGAISQGLIEPVTGEGDTAWISEEMKQRGYDITGCQGVTKWDPEPIPCHSGTLLPIGTIGLTKYDIEGADRYPEIIELLMDQPVFITEKLEGSNFSCTAKGSNERYVSQREHTIIPEEGKEHSFWKVALDGGLLSLAQNLVEDIEGLNRTSVDVYGEYIGPGMQGNIYKLAKNEVRIFDIRFDGMFLDAARARRIAEFQGLPFVPVLCSGLTLREWLAGRTVQEASDGYSVLNDNARREGIVIKPMTEQRHPTLGRLIIKQRSPAYLANSDL